MYLSIRNARVYCVTAELGKDVGAHKPVGSCKLYGSESWSLKKGMRKDNLYVKEGLNYTIFEHNTQEACGRRLKQIM